MLFNAIFEEDLVIFVRNEGKCCTILANFMNCTIISNAVGLKNLVILTLKNDKMRKILRTKLAPVGSLELFLNSALKGGCVRSKNKFKTQKNN